MFLGISGCGGCHALADAGSTGSVASDLDEKKPSEARVREFVVEGKDAMPPYDKQLSEQEIADVAAYVAAVGDARTEAGRGVLLDLYSLPRTPSSWPRREGSRGTEGGGF